MRALFRMMLALGGVLALSPGAGAGNPVKLQGDYQLAGRLDHKGSPTQGASHLYVSLTDQAARDLYESLPGDPREDACTGYKFKAWGNVGCYEIEPNDRYLCSFSIDLERGAVEAGLGGCI